MNEITPGMVLEKDVANIQGAVLLRKDSEVTDRHIKIFKTWGISSIFIKDTVGVDDLAGQSAQEASRQQIEDMKKGVEAKFAQVADDAIMCGIKEAAVRQRSAQILRKFNL